MADATGEDGGSGNSRRTSRSFRWGRWEVAMARRVGSVGEGERWEGVNVAQALE